MAKLGLVGCAHIHTPGFVKRLQARDDVTVKLVWDHDETRAQKNAAKLAAQAVPDVSAVWQDEEIQAVIICSETDRHLDLVMAGAAAGKHLFVEKPLGMGTEDAYAMAAAIEKAGVLFQTGYFMRGFAEHLFLRQQIREGSFGRVSRIRLSNCHSGSLGDWFTPEWLWMTDPQVSGVGAYGDLGTHKLDILLWLVDEEVDRVIAATGTATARYGPACDEYGEGLLRFKNGMIAALAAGWVDVADPVQLLISGTEGHAYVLNGEVYFKSEKVPGADGQKPWRDLPQGWPHAFELYLDAVVGASPPAGQAEVPLVSAGEAAWRSAVMEALYESARQQSWVEPRHP